MKLKQAVQQIFAHPTIRLVVGFTCLLYLLEELLFHPQLNYLAVMAFLPPPQIMISAVTGFISFLALTLFVFSTVSSPRWVQVIYFLLFAAAVIVEYGYQKSVGRFLIAADLQMGMRTPLETWQAAASLFLDWRAIFPVLAFLGLLRLNRTPTRGKHSLMALAAVLLLVVGVGAVRGGKVGTVNFGASPIQFFAAAYQFGTSGLFQPQRELLPFQAQSQPTNNIILIVDESVSGDHLSLNGYERPTTPYLDVLAQQDSLFHNWGLAVSGATCSEQSNGLLISGVPVAEGNLALIYRYPSLFQYAKAMNYTTYYLDAQTNTLWNGLSNKDITFIDNWITADDLGTKLGRDFAAADMIHDLVTSSTGHFIVLNKIGVHFLYESNYPPAATVWSPIPASGTDYAANLAYVNNAYDNALLYNVNGFFEHLFPEAEQLSQYTHNNFYFYTSDHGQTLYRGQTQHIHCGDTHWEATVPLLMVGQLEQPIDTAYEASHGNIFTTILDLMTVPLTERRYTYPLSLLRATQADETERLFFAGSVDVVENYDQRKDAAANK